MILPRVEEQTWPGGVLARTSEERLIHNPVIVTLDGQRHELSISEARLLLQGVTKALDVAQSNYANLTRGTYSVFALGEVTTMRSFILLAELITHQPEGLSREGTAQG